MKVLIIRLSSIGDVILTTPIVRLVHKNLNAEIHYLTNEVNFPIIEDNPYIEDYHSAEDIRKLQTTSYDLVIDLQNSIKSRRIKFEGGTTVIRTDKMPIRKWMMLLFRINWLHKTHVVTNHIKPLHELGISDDGNGLEVYVQNQDLRSAGLENLEDQIVINVGGSKKTKRIPLSMANSIIRESDHRYIIVGGDDVYEEYGTLDGENVINLVNQLSLSQTLQVIKGCKLLLTGDTALMHAAAAFNKDQIVIWGSTTDDFGFYPYYGSNNKDKSIQIKQNLSCQPCSKFGKNTCPKGHMRCLKDISAKEVLLSINKICSGN